MKSSMNGNDLFVHLVQHMRVYSDAAVLWVLLKEQADQREIAITSGSLSEIDLCKTVPIQTVKRTLQRLQEMGFIDARVQKNTRTLVRVNSRAVLNLLQQPISARLPAVSKKSFPFLDAWNHEIENCDAGATVLPVTSEQDSRRPDI